MISDLVIIGGGASGFMGAITAISNGLKSVVILETPKLLDKVRISGGGRCNLTNSCWDISDLVNNYPRGDKQLLGLLIDFLLQRHLIGFRIKDLILKLRKMDVYFLL